MTTKQAFRTASVTEHAESFRTACASEHADSFRTANVAEQANSFPTASVAEHADSFRAARVSKHADSFRTACASEHVDSFRAARVSKRISSEGTTISRRALLAGAAMAGLTFGKTASFKLGVASYSLRKLSRADAIKALEQLQIKYVNIKEYHAKIAAPEEEWKQARRDFENAGITILGVGNISMAKPDEGEIRRNFDYAKTLGAPLIVMAPIRETLPIIEKFVIEYNIKAAIHNHGPEDKHFAAPKDVLDAVSGMDKQMGLCIDVGHTTRTGADVVEWVKKAGDQKRLYDMHIKDLGDLMKAESQVPVGEGKMPIRAIFTELIRQGYTGGVMLEYEIDENNPVPGMQKSFAYMRKVLAELSS